MENIHKKVMGCGLTVACTISAVTNMSACARSVTVPEKEHKKAEYVIKESEVNVSMENNEDSILLAKELDSIYSNKAVRVLESTRIQLGEEKYNGTIAQLGSAEKCKDKGDYVDKLLSSVGNSDGEEAVTKVMRACGYQCLDPSLIDVEKQYLEQEKNVDSWIEHMNKNEIGGGHLIREGNKINATYDYCYCDIDHKEKLPGCYCQCSCGWFEKFFSSILEQPVEVTLTNSIMNGANQCDFVITLSEEID